MTRFALEMRFDDWLHRHHLTRVRLGRWFCDYFDRRCGE